MAKGKKMDQSWMVSCSNDMDPTSKIILITYKSNVGEVHSMALISITAPNNIQEPQAKVIGSFSTLVLFIFAFDYEVYMN